MVCLQRLHGKADQFCAIVGHSAQGQNSCCRSDLRFRSRPEKHGEAEDQLTPGAPRLSAALLLGKLVFAFDLRSQRTISSTLAPAGSFSL